MKRLLFVVAGLLAAQPALAQTATPPADPWKPFYGEWECSEASKSLKGVATDNFERKYTLVMLPKGQLFGQGGREDGASVGWAFNDGRWEETADGLAFKAGTMAGAWTGAPLTVNAGGYTPEEMFITTATADAERNGYCKHSRLMFQE